MALIRAAANKVRRGVVGQDTFYYTGGRQIVRQSRNNSNYGESASRTLAQQRRRVMWGNLVNFYQCIAPYMPKAFGKLPKGQTQFSKFMSLNIDKSTFPLSRSEAEEGLSVPQRWQISNGPMQPVYAFAQNVDDKPFFLDLEFPTTYPTGTVGAFSTYVVNHNFGFKNGDAVCLFLIEKDNAEVPLSLSDCNYVEIVLDTKSTTQLNSVPWTQWISIDQHGKPLVGKDDYDKIIACAAVHTRKVDSTLFCSKAGLALSSVFGQAATAANTPERLSSAINSYGLTSTPLISPGE